MADNKKIIERARHYLDVIEKEITDSDKLDVETAIGIKEIPPKDSYREWEIVPSQRTLVIKLNGGAVADCLD